MQQDATGCNNHPFSPRHDQRLLSIRNELRDNMRTAT
jgi:hypothetical protein